MAAVSILTVEVMIEGTTRMERPAGNRKLKAARLAAGFGSQQALADALNAAAEESGLRGIGVGARQVRRWETADPPWPQMNHQRLLSQVLGLPVDQLGFAPPWDSYRCRRRRRSRPDSGAGCGRYGSGGAVAPESAHPSTVPAGMVAITVVHAADVLDGGSAAPAPRRSSEHVQPG